MNHKLPESKDDFASITVLQQLEFVQITALIPDLLIWIQDGNWPIYQSIKELLLPQQENLIEPLKEILNSNDSSWKYFLLNDFIPFLRTEVIQKLIEELSMLSNHPTFADQSEEVDLLAQKILESANE